MGTNNLERIAALSKTAKLIIDRKTWYEIYTAALGERCLEQENGWHKAGIISYANDTEDRDLINI